MGLGSSTRYVELVVCNKGKPGRIRAGEAEERNEKGIGAATAKIYDLLWNGHYIRSDGRKMEIRGDVSKILSAVGLTQRQRALITNYQFMSAQIQGTRQIRRRINHLVFSARVF